MSSYINNYSNLDFIFVSLLCVFLGVSIRATLTSVNQKWASTYHFTLTCALLPSITMAITTLISSNLALSLGMIGALSIVRFRNPVKSPFELIIFFSLITIGIGAAVNLKLSIFLSFLINFIIYIFFKIEKFFEKKKKSIFSPSFDEGSKVYSLEVRALQSISILEFDENLVEKFRDMESKEFSYRLIFSSRKELEELNNKLNNNSDVQKVNVHYPS